MCGNPIVKEELGADEPPIEDVAIRRDALLLKRIGNKDAEATAIDDSDTAVDEDGTAGAVFPDCDAADVADSDEIDTRMVDYDDGVAPLPSTAPPRKVTPSSSASETPTPTPTPTPSKSPSVYTTAAKSRLAPRGVYFEPRRDKDDTEAGVLLYVEGKSSWGSVAEAMNVNPKSRPRQVAKTEVAKTVAAKARLQPTAKTKPALPTPPPPPSDAVRNLTGRDLVPHEPNRPPSWRDYKAQDQGEAAAKLLQKSVGKSPTDTTDGKRSGWMTRAGILSDFILAGKFEEARTLAGSFKRRQDAADDEPPPQSEPKRGRNSSSSSSSSSNNNNDGGGWGGDDRGWSRNSWGGSGSGWSRSGGSRDWRGKHGTGRR